MKKQAKKVNKCSEFEMHFRVGTEEEEDETQRKL